MSEEGSSIVCRRCGEVIPLDAGSCPHCGQEIRGTAGPVGGVVLGVLLVIAAIFGGSRLYVFGALGLLLGAASGYLLYDKRRRIQEAASRGGVSTSEGEAAEEGEESETIF